MMELTIAAHTNCFALLRIFNKLNGNISANNNLLIKIYF